MPAGPPFTGVGVDPRMSSALNLPGAIQLKVTYTEAMNPNADLTDPTNYTLTPDAGSVARQILAIQPENMVNPTFVTLFLDDQFTGGTDNYNIAVVLVEDLAGNVIDVAFDDVDFDGQGPVPDGVSVLSLNLLLDPAAAPDNGGVVLTFSGVFPLTPIIVSIVAPAGEVDCYSGQSGNGNEAIRVDASTLKVVAPVLPLGIFDVIARSGVLTDTLVAGLPVVNRFFHSKVLDLRKLFPPVLAVGPRDLDITDDLA